jgi:hypothetical protein
MRKAQSETGEHSHQLRSSSGSKLKINDQVLELAIGLLSDPRHDLIASKGIATSHIF